MLRGPNIITIISRGHTTCLTVNQGLSPLSERCDGEGAEMGRQDGGGLRARGTHEVSLIYSTGYYIQVGWETVLIVDQSQVFPVVSLGNNLPLRSFVISDFFIDPGLHPSVYIIIDQATLKNNYVSCPPAEWAYKRRMGTNFSYFSSISHIVSIQRKKHIEKKKILRPPDWPLLWPPAGQFSDILPAGARGQYKI